VSRVVKPMILFIAWVIMCACGAAQELSFYQENIFMRLEPGNFFVTGHYFLKGEPEKNYVLTYPFPVDKSYGEVDSLLIMDLNTGRFIEPLSRKPSGILFKVEFGDTSDIVIQIFYRQKLPGTRAEYILTSTLGWKKPLERANFQLLLKPDIHITGFSIPPDDSAKSTTEQIYYWFMKDFMPEKNMVLEFRYQ
jgi:hypothetical protein